MCKVSLISSNKSSGIPITSLHLKSGATVTLQTPLPEKQNPKHSYGTL